GTGYTSRILTAPDSDIAEDRVVTTAGSYSATAPLSGGAWIMQLAAFRAAGSVPPPVDTTPPVVAITSPSAGATVSGNISVNASASDTQTGVASVQLFVDGAAVGQPDASSPYSFVLDTRGYGNGAHVLSANATDGAGNVGGSAPVSVTFSN